MWFLMEYQYCKLRLLGWIYSNPVEMRGITPNSFKRSKSALLRMFLKNQTISLAVVKKNPNPYGKGKPVSQEIFVEGLKPFEAELDSEAKKSHEMYNRSKAEGDKILNSLIDKLKQAGVDFESITVESVKTIRQLAEQDRKERMMK